MVTACERKTRKMRETRSTGTQSVECIDCGLVTPGDTTHPEGGVMVESSAAGDSIPANCEIIEVRVAELRQLFNAIDPAPLRERELDARVEEFIVEQSRQAPRRMPLALLVLLDRRAGPADEAALLRDAIRQHFSERARSSRQRLQRLFHRGRISLIIGLAVLTAFTGLAELVAARTSGGGFGRVLYEGLSIGGWVAMWRPLEVFLYDWWPIRADAKLFDRLAAMPVRISYGSAATPERRVQERPAASRAEKPTRS
jgi:hypothetical protein